MIASKRDTALRLAQEHHHRATEHADRGEWPEALAQEVAAVGYYLPLDVEPSRSILCRSAACLALKTDRNILAIALASIGLEGTPPDCVREELRSVHGDAMDAIDERHPGDVRKALSIADIMANDLREHYADKPRFRDRLPAWLRRVLCALKS